MGGSLAKAVKRYGISKKVYGFTNSEKNAKEIEELGLVDELVDLETLKKVSDVIILSIPVDAIISMFPNFLDIGEKTTIIDMGSTKEYIVKSIPPKIRKNFIAAHPMTGTEKSGPKAAIDDLYEGKTVVFCDLEDNENLHVNKAFKIFFICFPLLTEFLSFIMIYQGSNKVNKYHIIYFVKFCMLLILNGDENFPCAIKKYTYC